jgi:hypothetical protein
MRVVAQVKSFYDWESVPSDVVVTPQDIKAGRVKPAMNSGYLMRVTKKTPSETTVCISEETIVQRIIHEMMPNQGCVPHSRKEAVGQILARQVMPEHAHPKFITQFRVDTDDGPDEKLFMSLVEPFTKVMHDKSGQPGISPDDLETLRVMYMEPTTPKDHVDHLHAKFNVKPSAEVKAVTP